MFWVAILASHHKNPNALGFLPVNDGVGKVLQYVNSSCLVRWCAYARKLGDHLYDPPEFIKEPTCKLAATFLSIEPCCFQ